MIEQPNEICQVFPYADAIEKALAREDMTYRRERKDDTTVFYIMAPNSTISALALGIMLGTTGDVKMFCRLASVPESVNRSALLELINNINDRFRFIKLVIDKENDLICLHDFLLEGSDEAGAGMVMETMGLIIRIVDDCLQEIMENIYKDAGIQASELFA